MAEKVLLRNESMSEVEQEGSMAQLLASSERELSAFITAVNQLFNAEQGRKAAQIWIAELVRKDWPNGMSVLDLRWVTIAAVARLIRPGKGRASGS